MYLYNIKTQLCIILQVRNPTSKRAELIINNTHSHTHTHTHTHTHVLYIYIYINILIPLHMQGFISLAKGSHILITNSISNKKNHKVNKIRSVNRH